MREHIAHFKCAQRFEFHYELPRLPTGKLYKNKLRSPHWDNRDRDI